MDSFGIFLDLDYEIFYHSFMSYHSKGVNKMKALKNKNKIKLFILFLIICFALVLIIFNCNSNSPDSDDSAGNPYSCKAIGWIGGASNGWKISAGTSSGTDYQSFNSPHGVRVDGAGNIYTAEFGNNRISKWTSAGNAFGWIGGASDDWKTTAAPSSGSDYRSFSNPFGVHVDGTGNIYIPEQGNYRISKWK